MKKYKQPLNNQITIYQSPDGGVNIEVLYAEENIWLTQKKMAELFGCSSDNVSFHLKNIYNEKELEKSATTEDFSVVQKEGEAARRKAMTMKDWTERLNGVFPAEKYHERYG